MPHSEMIVRKKPAAGSMKKKPMAGIAQGGRNHRTSLDAVQKLRDEGLEEARIRVTLKDTFSASRLSTLLKQTRPMEQRSAVERVQYWQTNGGTLDQYAALLPEAFQSVRTRNVHFLPRTMAAGKLYMLIQSGQDPGEMSTQAHEVIQNLQMNIDGAEGTAFREETLFLRSIFTEVQAKAGFAKALDFENTHRSSNASAAEVDAFCQLVPESARQWMGLTNFSWKMKCSMVYSLLIRALEAWAEN